MYKISYSDAIANAFMFYLSQTDSRKLPKSKVDDYIKAVNSSLKKSGNTLSFYFDTEDYSYWWSFEDENNETVIILRDNIKIDDLIEKFVGTLPLDLLLEFRNIENTIVLL